MKNIRDSALQLVKFAQQYWIGIFAAVFAIGVAVVAGDRWALSVAKNDAQRAAASRAATAQGLLASQLQKYRLLPLVLADYPDVQAALETRTPAAIVRLNARLELIAEHTDAAVIYVVDADGTTIAASNWKLPTSFIGQDYGFRPYFTNAMRIGAAEQFALGTVSKRPGLFLARRVGRHGVVVVKVEFGPMEAAWAHQDGPTIVRDGNGVIIMTSRPAWRLRATQPLTPETANAIQRARLYGEGVPPALAPDLTLADAHSISEDRSHSLFAAAALPIPVTNWTVVTLEPIEPALAAARAEIRAFALGIVLILVILMGWRMRAREARQLRETARSELEEQVTLRTAELRNANELLVRESREREKNEARLRTAREDLAQSNRLATLGQITAGVAHEINQPLAALRSFAENAHVLSERGKDTEVRSNLDHIVSLAQRIGDITGELRLFARRESGKGPVSLSGAIDGSLLLTGDRLRQLGVIVERRGDAPSQLIAADRIKLEQIMINLIQNAGDAVAGQPMPRITIQTMLDKTGAKIAITDNGPGVSRDGQRDLFKSFVTQKPDGLGLGLVIARDLAREVGGELTYVPGGPGATFLLRLPLA